MNRFLTAANALALFAAAPVQAQLTTAPSTWQVSDNCTIRGIEVDTKTNTEKILFETRCNGISVSVKNNINVHFSAAHPSLGMPVMSFVLAEGPFQGKHPVSDFVLNLGTPDQGMAEAHVGWCDVTRKPGYSFVFCGSSTYTTAAGKYLRVASGARFNDELAPEIKSALR